MNFGKRRPQGPSAGRLVALLVSVIALALVFFVVPAQAEECTSSSCVQYSPSLPNAEGGHAPTHHQKTPAKASKTGDGGGTAPANRSHSDDSGEAEESGEGEESSQQGGVAGGDSGSTGQGKPGSSANQGPSKVAHPSESATAKPASHTEDGGSSPLVPILIAIAVLAAISVAVVMIRQRRQRPGGPKPTTSPEAN